MSNRFSIATHFLLLALLGFSAQAADLAECAKGSDPLSPLIAEPILILGEIHGTVETPSVAGAQACALLRTGKKVLLALEIPTDEQERIDAFLASSGEAADVRSLVSGGHWQQAAEHQDGRSSESMLGLIQLARQLAKATGNIRLLAFDQWRSDTPRDVLMARNIEAALMRYPGYSTVVLVGNVHATGARGTPLDPGFEPMAYQLRARRPRSIEVVPASGEAWFCSPTCAVHPIASVLDPRAKTELKLGFSLMPGFDGTLFLSQTAASPPAMRRIGIDGTK